MLRSVQLFCVLLSTILLLSTPAALAQASRSQHRLSAMEYSVLSRAQHFLEEKKDQAARQTLHSFLSVIKFRPYPKALALNMLASTYLSVGEYTKALPLLQQAVVTHALPHKQQRNAKYNLAVAYAQTKKPAKAAALLKKLIPEYKHPSTDQLLLAATTNFQAKHMAAAQKYALATLKAQGAHPSKAPYQILLSLQFKAKDYLAALKTTHTMMKLWPDDNSQVTSLANLQLMWIGLASQTGKIPSRQLASRVTIERPPKHPQPPKVIPPEVSPPKLIPQHSLPPLVTQHIPLIEPIPSLPADIQAATAAPSPSISAHVPKPLDVYVAALHARIQDGIRVVRMVRRLSLSGTVLVRFVLPPGGGRAREIRIIGGSKNPLLIQSALDTVHAFVFPPFLAGMRHHSIIFDVPIQIYTMS